MKMVSINVVSGASIDLEIVKDKLDGYSNLEFDRLASISAIEEVIGKDESGVLVLTDHLPDNFIPKVQVLVDKLVSTDRSILVCYGGTTGKFENIDGEFSSVGEIDDSILAIYVKNGLTSKESSEIESGEHADSTELMEDKQFTETSDLTEGGLTAESDDLTIEDDLPEEDGLTEEDDSLTEDDLTVGDASPEDDEIVDEDDSDPENDTEASNEDDQDNFDYGNNITSLGFLTEDRFKFPADSNELHTVLASLSRVEIPYEDISSFDTADDESSVVKDTHVDNKEEIAIDTVKSESKLETDVEFIKNILGSLATDIGAVKLAVGDVDVELTDKQVTSLKNKLDEKDEVIKSQKKEIEQLKVSMTEEYKRSVEEFKEDELLQTVNIEYTDTKYYYFKVFNEPIYFNTFIRSFIDFVSKNGSISVGAVVFRNLNQYGYKLYDGIEVCSGKKETFPTTDRFVVTECNQKLLDAVVEFSKSKRVMIVLDYLGSDTPLFIGDDVESFCCTRLPKEVKYTTFEGHLICDDNSTSVVDLSYDDRIPKITELKFKIVRYKRKIEEMFKKINQGF